MRRTLLLALPLALAAAASAPAVAGASPSPTAVSHRVSHVCSAPAPGDAGCHALRADTVTSSGAVVQAAPNATATPAGLGPADIRGAYGLTGTASGGRTVAIVDAYDAPTAEADLATYRSTYGLPPCTTASGCFRKVDQTGGTKYPRANGGWAQEISLDLDMVSAAYPDCRILLVEASSASFADLGAGVNTAAPLGATAISNSYGGADSSASSAYDHPGIAVTAATGDSGYGVQSPASFRTVVAVGGTSLRHDGSTRGWSESAWSGAGSGCSTLNPKPTWQSTATGCAGKANAGGLNDVATGSNGTCPTAQWCTAGTGWDGPTGLGTPHGTTAF